MIDKDAVYAHADALFDRLFPLIPKHGGCVYWSIVTVAALRNLDADPCVQAGSAQFRFADDVDGVQNTHLSFMWNGDPETQIQHGLANGNLPEMHCWVVDLKTEEFIDFSAGHLRTYAEEAGLTWTANDPPKYIWGPHAKTEDFALYAADLNACLTASRVVNDIVKDLGRSQ